MILERIEIRSRVIDAITNSGSNGLSIHKICQEVFEVEDIRFCAEIDVVFKVIDELLRSNIIIQIGSKHLITYKLVQ